jgi:hypothetical protein
MDDLLLRGNRLVRPSSACLDVPTFETTNIEIRAGGT